MTQTQGVAAEEVGAAAATVVAGNFGSFHSAAPLPAPPGLAAAPLRSPATRRGPTLECRRSSLATLTQQLQLEVEEVVVEAGAGAATEVAGSFGLFSRLPRLALAFLRSRATHRARSRVARGTPAHLAVRPWKQRGSRSQGRRS